MNLAHGHGNPLLRLLLREHARFGIWHEHRRLHGDFVRMRRDIIRQDQHGHLAIAHEIACHRENEVGIGAVHLGQILLDHIHRDVMSAFDQVGPPATHIVVVKQRRHLRTEAARLHQNSRDNPIGRPLQEIPDEWAADAKAH